MARKIPTIAAKIQQYYCSADGTWLVEKGKVKEAKMLKEAFEHIQELNTQIGYWSDKFWDLEESTDERIEMALSDQKSCQESLEAENEDLLTEIRDLRERMEKISKLSSD